MGWLKRAKKTATGAVLTKDPPLQAQPQQAQCAHTQLQQSPTLQQQPSPPPLPPRQYHALPPPVPPSVPLLPPPDSPTSSPSQHHVFSYPSPAFLQMHQQPPPPTAFPTGSPHTRGQAWVPPAYDFSRPIVNYYITIQSPVSATASPGASPNIGSGAPGSPTTTENVASLAPAAPIPPPAPRGRLMKVQRSIGNLTEEYHRRAQEYHETGHLNLEGVVPQVILNQTTALSNQIFGKFNDLMALVELDKYRGSEKDLFVCDESKADEQGVENGLETSLEGLETGLDDGLTPASRTTSKSSSLSKEKESKESKKEKSKEKGRKSKESQKQTAGATVATVTNYITRASRYSNSRLPADLQPLRCSLEAWRLVCLAARYSLRAYDAPQASERNMHFEPNWRTGAKAMVIKSVPMDDQSAVVFAIRGTASIMDWLVNLKAAPVAPTGFLDDETNVCHAGFLAVARAMVSQVAARLRELLEENPGRKHRSTLVLTGHSAGGAVACLLFSHMLSTGAFSSELKDLVGCFRRVHCITFGAPPVSRVALDNPTGNRGYFMTFVNEGDPVTRADKAYVRSLLDCYSTVPPSRRDKSKGNKGARSSSKPRKLSITKTKSNSSSGPSSPESPSLSSPTSPTSSSKREWKIPDCTLSNAGNIVVLRPLEPKSKFGTVGRSIGDRLKDEGVMAATVDEKQLRGVLWGDPVCHSMEFYALRVEVLASRAVTAKEF